MYFYNYVGFRENKALTDENKIKKCVDEAERGFRELSRFSKVVSQKNNWKVDIFH
jgi:hypothetical protein